MQHELVTTRPNASIIPVRKFSDEGIKVVASLLPYSIEPKLFEACEGMSIQEMMDNFIKDPDLQLSVHCYIGATYIQRKYWSQVYPKPGAVVSIKLVPQKGGGGKKNPLATILTIAVMAAAAWAGPAIAGSMGFAAGTTGFKVAAALGTALVSTVGNLLVSAIAPPPKQRMNAAVTNPAEAQTLFIEGARNEADPYGVVPQAFGKVRVFPKLSANNYTESSGDDQYVRQLFCWGLGKYDLQTLIDNLKIGETRITEYDGVELQHDMEGRGVDAGDDLNLYPNDIFQEDLSRQFKYTDGWIQQTSQSGANELILDITLPNGCVQFNDQGGKNTHTVNIEARYSVAGANTWSSVQQLTISASKTAAIRRHIRFADLPEGQYDVQVRRTTADTTSDKVFDATWWTALKTVTYQAPVNMKGISQTAMRMKGTDQLSGAVDQLNSILYSVLPDYDHETGEWVERPTQNPASFFRYVLQNSELWVDDLGELSPDAPNARGLKDNRIYLANIEDFHDHCRLNGFEYNAYIDWEASVWDMLQEIASCGRAAPTLIDGKWGVVIDRVPDYIAQHVTTSNSWGYNAVRIFPSVPHAFRVQFNNEDAGFIQDERLVYADGYDENTARKIEGLQLPGITNPDLVWKHGREHLATVILRPYEHTFYMDVEHLNAVRGSKIKFSHRVPLIGLEDGFILEVLTDAEEEPNVTGVRLDRPVNMMLGKTYSLRARDTKTGLSVYKELQTVPGERDTVFFSVPFPESDVGMKVDDLFMFGETGLESIDLIVKDVVPEQDLTAKLVCVDAAPEIAQASEGVIPAFQSRISVPAELLRPQAPVIVGIQTGAEVQVMNLDGTVSNRMVITLRNDNAFEVVPIVKIKRSDSNDFYEAQVISATANQVVLEGLDQRVRYDLQIYYKKVGNSSTTMFGGTTYSPITSKNLVLFEGVSDLPPNITNFNIQVVGENVLLSWNDVGVLDFWYYEIRYTPSVDGISWNTAQVIKTRLTNTETIVPAATGTFLIKAFDRGGRESAVATYSSISVVLEGMNAVEVVQQDPTFPGTHTNTVVTDDDTLELDDLSLAEGIYEFPGYTDLSEVYQCRVTPHLVVGGRNVTFFMSTWSSLSTIGTLDGSQASDWSVRLEAAFTNDDPSGTPTWTAWAPLGIGTQTFRAVKFRILLFGNGSNVTPSVEELRVLIDMPDRITKVTEITCPNTGLTVTYDPAYKNNPTVNITIYDQQTGDWLDYSSKDSTGFVLTIRNSSNVAVTRIIDYTAIGYGRVIT